MLPSNVWKKLGWRRGSYPAKRLARGSENPRESQRATTRRKPKKLHRVDLIATAKRDTKVESFTRFCARYMPSSVTPWTRAQRYFATRLARETIIRIREECKCMGLSITGRNVSRKEEWRTIVGNTFPRDSARELKLKIKNFRGFTLGWYSHSELIVTYER